MDAAGGRRCRIAPAGDGEAASPIATGESRIGGTAGPSARSTVTGGVEPRSTATTSRALRQAARLVRRRFRWLGCVRGPRRSRAEFYATGRPDVALTGSRTTRTSSAPACRPTGGITLESDRDTASSQSDTAGDHQHRRHRTWWTFSTTRRTTIPMHRRPTARRSRTRAERRTGNRDSWGRVRLNGDGTTADDTADRRDARLVAGRTADRVRARWQRIAVVVELMGADGGGETGFPADGGGTTDPVVDARRLADRLRLEPELFSPTRTGSNVTAVLTVPAEHLTLFATTRASGRSRAPGGGPPPSRRGGGRVDADGDGVSRRWTATTATPRSIPGPATFRATRSTRTATVVTRASRSSSAKSARSPRRTPAAT